MLRLLVAVFAATIVPAISTGPTPLVVWSFDEAAGCLANSSLPGLLGPQCSSNNSALWTEGVSGTALTFDGDDDKVTAEHDPAVLPSSLSDFTLSAWIKASDQHNSWRAIVDKRSDNDDGLDLFLDPAGKIFVRANTLTLSGHSNVADGTWHHVVGVYEGGGDQGKLSVYVDGALDGSAAMGKATAIDVAVPFYIGRHYGGTSYTFSGSIDEVTMYGEALYATEVLALYKMVNRPALASILGSWEMDDGEGCVAADTATAGGVNHPGFLLPTNCQLYGPAWTQDRNNIGGRALAFDGDDDAVNVPHADPFSPIVQITVTAWISHNLTSKYRAIVDKRDSAEDGFDLFLDPNSKLYFRANTFTLAGVIDVADGLWHHVAGTYDGISLRLYVDGALEASVTVGLTQLQTTADLKIGHHHSSDDFTFQGVLDEVRVYRDALDIHEIQDMYTSKTIAPTESPILSPVIVPTSAQTYPPSSRIGYWPFDENTGCTAAEVVAGENGTLGPSCPYNAPSWITGVSGSSLAFDDAVQFFEVDPTDTLGTLENFTIAAWIQAFGPCTSGQWCAILDKRDSNNDGFDLYLDNESKLFMRLNQGILSSDIVVGDGSWHHVAGTYDGTTMRLYVDGSIQGTKNSIVGLIKTTEAPLYFGNHWRADPHAFIGHIDEVQIFDQALTENVLSSLRPAGPDLNAAVVSVSQNPLYVNGSSTVEAVLSAVLPGPAFTKLEGKIELDPSLHIVQDLSSVIACPGGTCVFNASDLSLSYHGTLAPGQSLRISFVVQAVAARVGAIVKWEAETIEPAEVTSAHLPNSDRQTLDIAMPGSALAYFVDAASGDDTNPGTEEAPFRTLQRCVDLWNNGIFQQGCSCTGVFSEEVSFKHGGPSPTRRNYLLPWDTNNNGDLADELFVLDGLQNQNKGLVALYPNKPKNIEVGYLTIRNLEPDGGCGDDNELIAIHMKCSGGEGCANWWIHHTTIVDIGPTCNVASHYIALQPSNMPNLLFEQNRLQRIGGFMIRYSAGDNITIRENIFEVNGTGIKAWGDTQDNLKVIDNMFLCDGNGYNSPNSSNDCGGQTAVNFANNIQHGVIRGNIFENCKLPINIGADERAGCRSNAHHVVENNFILQTEQVCSPYANAISIDDVADPSNCKTTSGDYIQVKDVIFRNNVMIFDHPVEKYSQGAAIILRASHNFSFTSDLRFYHNTIQGYSWGILPSVGLYPVGNTSKPYNHQLSGVDFRNNIFSNIHDKQINTGNFDTFGLPPPASWHMNSNVYSGADTFRWNGTQYTFSGWQNAVGYDMTSAFCAPTFADLSTLSLSWNDTCARDRGENLTDVPLDRHGNHRPAGPSSDVGADEFVSQSP